MTECGNKKMYNTQILDSDCAVTLYFNCPLTASRALNNQTIFLHFRTSLQVKLTG